MADNGAVAATDRPPMIYGAIANVIADVGFVAKDKVNKQQGFKYRSIDDVFNAIHPALAKNKVFIVPTIMERTSEVIGKTQKGTDMTKVTCKIKFTFFAEDGSFVESVIVGEGLDTGDKATNKAMAIAYKYACFQVFCIPTEDMIDDPDSESQELDDKAKKGSRATGDSGSKGKKADGNRSTPKSKTKEDEVEEPVEDARITESMLNTIKSEQMRTGVTDKQILGMKSVKAKTIPEMTVKEFKFVMGKFEKTPDLAGGEQSE